MLTRAGARRACQRLGRSAHADACRACAAAAYRRQRIRDFVKRIGVAKANSIVDIAHARYSRSARTLNKTAPRAHGGAAAAQGGDRELSRRPGRRARRRQPSRGSGARHAADSVRARALHRAGRLHGRAAEEVLPPGAGPRGAPALRAISSPAARSIKDADGDIVELRCTYDPATRGGNAPDGRKVKATIHWVGAAHAVPAEVRLYDRLFTGAAARTPRNFATQINPNSLEVLTGCMARAGARERQYAAAPVQFERQGYFCRDHGLHAGQAGVQPHRRIARHLGQGLRPG